MHDAKQSEPIRHKALDKLTKTLYNAYQVVADRGQS